MVPHGAGVHRMTGGEKGPTSLSMRIQYGFGWLKEALGIEKAPDRIGDELVGIVDSDQRGWGHTDTEILPFSYTVTVTAPPQTFDLLTGVDAATRAISPDVSRQIVVLSLSMIGGASSLPGDVWLTYRANVNGTVVVHSVASMGTPLTVAAGTPVDDSPTANSQAFLPNGHLWVPRGYRPQIRVYAFDAIEVSGAAAIMRAGFAGGAP